MVDTVLNRRAVVSNCGPWYKSGLTTTLVSLYVEYGAGTD